MKRETLVRGILVLALFSTLIVSPSCATRKSTRKELNALEDNLSARLDGDENHIAALENHLKDTTQHLNAVEKTTNDNTTEIAKVRSDLRGEITKVDAKATAAGNAARNAQSSADKANASISSLEALLRNKDDYEVIAEKQISFRFNSSKLAEDAEVPLSELAKQLKEDSGTFVVLEGRTDNVGDAAYNIQLSEKRNEAVTRFLIVTQAVPMYKIRRTSFGKEQPIAPNDSEEGRERNRSVLLRVYRAKGPANTTR